MKNDKYILNIKQLLFTIITVFLLCVSCVNDEFDSNVAVTEDIVIANEMEATMKAIEIIYREIENISEKMRMGVAIGVKINEEKNEWEYVFDTNLLSGKVVVGYSEQNAESSNIKNVDCSLLKIHYYENIWLRMFGSFTIESMDATQGSKNHRIQTKEFGYADGNLSATPDIVVNSDYIINYTVTRESAAAQIIFSGSGYGYNKFSGSYRQTITENIKTDIKTFNIIDGKIVIIIDKYGEKLPVEIEYSELGRTVRYNGNEQITYYNN
jgi:hypothetical protein